MDEPPLNPLQLSGVKRSHDGSSIGPVTSPDGNYFLSTPQSLLLPRAESPALSTTSFSLTELSSNGLLTMGAASTGSPSKKRKLNFAEKQAEMAEKRRQKDEQLRLKVEEKARRDEEKRLKDEDKRRKAEEREAAKKVKDVEKAQKDTARAAKKKAKDAEKAEKEVERLKKERAQMRLGAFFGHAPASNPSSTPDDVSSGVSSRRSSITSIDMEKPEVDIKQHRTVNPAYTSWILPFFPHEHTEIAPNNRFLQSARGPAVDPVCLDTSTRKPMIAIEPINQRFRAARSRKTVNLTVKDIVSRSNGSEQRPIDVTADVLTDDIELSLGRIPYKFLSFRDDVRPPYRGTFSRIVSPTTSRKLSRKPTCRGLPQTDYDYDSEAEWEAPEAGDEDLEDEDELSDEDDVADEMADFLDDEDEISRRRVTVADAEPLCTGLCWQGGNDTNAAGIEMAMYRMIVLHDKTRLPIDPYSTTHWAEIDKTPIAKTKEVHSDKPATQLMQPPRLPLNAVNNPSGSPMKKYFSNDSDALDSFSQQENVLSDAQQKATLKSKKPTKKIPSELLPTFKAAVSGSDLNKVALIEILKKQFPKCPKDAIKGTLENIAVRQGVKEADKRWVLIT